MVAGTTGTATASTTAEHPGGLGGGPAVMRTRAPHRWTEARAGRRVEYTCARCGLVLVAPRGVKPYERVRGRWVGTRELGASDVMPECSASRGEAVAAPPATYRNSPETRRMLASVGRTLGAAWVAETLGTSGVLDDWQEVELLRLYHALRVEDLDAQDAQRLVRDRLRALRHCQLEMVAGSERRLA